MQVEILTEMTMESICKRPCKDDYGTREDARCVERQMTRDFQFMHFLPQRQTCDRVGAWRSLREFWADILIEVDCRRV